MLPKNDIPVYTVFLPLSKKEITYRPFTVKEQKMLLMASESGESSSIRSNVKQILKNCTISELDIDNLPLVEIEFYFLQLRSRSVGEIIELKYRCENEVDDKKCSNIMDTQLNLLDVKITENSNISDVIQISPSQKLKLSYPKFSTVNKTEKLVSKTEIAYQMIIDSLDWIFDGKQYYYFKEFSKEESMEWLESLTQEQFSKIELFFDGLPTLKHELNVTCGKCSHNHVIELEGLDSFFG